jgi:broad specificity phosphatase PhoE
MRVLEVRRHSLVKDHVHLSQAGVDLARRVGQTTGPFDLVYTSQITRTLETAVAMGFAVTGQSDGLDDLVAEARAEFGHHERWTWERPFAAFAELIRQGGATARLGRAQADAWRSIVRALPEGGRALVISHGSIIEIGLVACLPRHDHVAWGPPFDKCEGARLTYQDDAWVALELLRVDGQLVAATIAQTNLPGWSSRVNPV